MIAMFNPIARSLRTLSQISDLKHVRQRFGVTHDSLGSLSEAARLFDPELLTGVISELAGELRGVQNDPRLASLKNPLTAVDGTLPKALPRMVESAWLDTKDGRTRHAWRLHLQFNVDRSVPTRVELTDPSNSGHSDEKDVLRKAVEPGRCYVMDRWFGQFTLFNAIVAARSDYICRTRDNCRVSVVEARPLTDEADAAGVISDSVVQLGLSSGTALVPNTIGVSQPSKESTRCCRLPAVAHCGDVVVYQPRLGRSRKLLDLAEYLLDRVHFARHAAGRHQVGAVMLVDAESHFLGALPVRLNVRSIA